MTHLSYLRFTGAVLVLALLLTSNLYGQALEDFEIHVFNVKKGTTEQVTDFPGAGTYNPSFSNNGKQIVFDVVAIAPSFTHDLYVVDLKKGTSAPLEGGDGGNDSAWSPNGKFIAFDRAPYGDASVYIVPSEGGSRTLIRSDAGDPSWSNNSDRLAFVDFTDGSIRTIALDGTGETLVGFGGQPAWAPNGKAIAYSDGNNIFSVAVDEEGNATSAPVQLTTDDPGAFSQQPSWSNNSKTVVFHSLRETGDVDIWSVSASGGTPTQVTGLADSGDFDPDYSKNGKLIAYAGAGVPTAGPVVHRVAAAALAPAITAASYPNPFNPTTTIGFTLPEAAYATVKVYNLVGQEVAVLANGPLDAGTHTLMWDAGQLPTGIYLYRITTPTGSLTRSVTLMK